MEQYTFAGIKVIRIGSEVQIASSTISKNFNKIKRLEHIAKNKILKEKLSGE